MTLYGGLTIQLLAYSIIAFPYLHYDLMKS